MTLRLPSWCVAMLILAVGGQAWGAAPATRPAAAAPLRVAMWSGSAEYKSDQSLPILKKELEAKLGATCTVHNVPKENDTLPGLDDLATADVIVLFTRRTKVPADQLAKVKAYLDSGKGVVGIRTASHGFQTWLEYDKLVQGGDYQNHAKDAVAKVTPAEKSKDHPVLAGVEAFSTPGKLYFNPKLAPDVTVLLTADNGKDREPVAWVRPYRGGRVFYTSLGVPDDFKDKAFLRLMTNAVQWAAARNGN